MKPERSLRDRVRVFFMVKEGVLITPQLTDSVLESITRNTIIKIAQYMDIPILERTIDRTELYTCDEAFLCGSAMELTPILSIDRYKISTDGVGEITRKLHKSYLDVVRNKIDIYKEWVTAIYD